MRETWNCLQQTDYARLSVNTLRKLTFNQKVSANPDKKSIQLQLGDPTIFGNFLPSKESVDALRNAVDNDTFLYNPGHGRLEAREAVAEYAQHMGKVTSDDIVLTSGCGHAIEMCILSLAAPGDNVLIPRPCFSYQPLTDGPGIVTRFYNLDPSKGWNVDLSHMESVIDDKTRAIVVNHPGNPCGNVFSKEHILDILAIAERYRLPVISDEVYEFMVYPGVEFHSIASLSKNVPVLTCSALTKRFLMPGMRLGWIIVNDRNGILADIKLGLRNITGKILGPNSIVQYALPDILRNTPQWFYDNAREIIAVSIFQRLMIHFYVTNNLIFSAALESGLQSSEKHPRINSNNPQRLNVRHDCG